MGTELVGTWVYNGGANGTVNLPKGAILKQIVVVGGAGLGSIVIAGGDSIPVPIGASLSLRFHHKLATSPQAYTVVFTGTASYFLEYAKAGNT